MEIKRLVVGFQKRLWNQLSAYHDNCEDMQIYSTTCYRDYLNSLRSLSMDSTLPKPFAFVLMPFSKEFDDVYKLGIKPACENAGAYAERVDEQIYQDSILQRIYNQIAKADIVISDMTGRNPNVFYETGYAHALGKQVILLTSHSEDKPFDVEHYPHIIYEGRITDLIKDLERHVNWAIEKKEVGPSMLHEPQISIYVDGVSLDDNPTIKYKFDEDVLDLKIDVTSSIEKSTKVANFRAALITSNRFHLSRQHNIVKLPTGGLIHIKEEDFSVSPGYWVSIYFYVSDIEEYLKDGDVEDMILRIYKEQIYENYPFRISFKKKKW